jgi:hypothetical protein
MAKNDLAAEWLKNKQDLSRRFDPFDDAGKFIRVKYHREAIPDAADDTDRLASQDHLDRYRKLKKVKAIRASGPYCEKVAWLKMMVEYNRDDCLLFPKSHPGFKQQVRFNYRTVAASRAMCILAHGLPKDPKMMAIHSCGNGHLSCVNPRHLRWGTASDNAKDRRAHKDKLTATERINAVVK